MVLQGHDCGCMGEKGTAPLQQNWVLGPRPVSAGGRADQRAGVSTAFLGEVSHPCCFGRPQGLDCPVPSPAASGDSCWLAWALCHLPLSPGLPWEQSLPHQFSASAWAGTSPSHDNSSIAPITLAQPGLPSLPAPALTHSFCTPQLPLTCLQ